MFRSHLSWGSLKSRGVAQKALRWNVLFFFDAHGVLFTLSLLSAPFIKGTYYKINCPHVWSKPWRPYLIVHCVKYCFTIFEPRQTKTNQLFSYAFSSWHMSRNVRLGKFSLFFPMWGKVFPNLLGAKKNWMFMVMREVGEWARILERFVTLMTPFADDNSINSNLCAPHTKIQHQKQN